MRRGVPVAIRYPNSGEDERVKAVFYPDGPAQTIGVRTNYGSDRIPDAVVVCHGRMAQEALAAADRLEEEGIRLFLRIVHPDFKTVLLDVELGYELIVRHPFDPD